jgi:hypothetical protein
LTLAYLVSQPTSAFMSVTHTSPAWHRRLATRYLVRRRDCAVGRAEPSSRLQPPTTPTQVLHGCQGCCGQSDSAWATAFHLSSPSALCNGALHSHTMATPMHGASCPNSTHRMVTTMGRRPVHLVGFVVLTLVCMMPAEAHSLCQSSIDNPAKLRVGTPFSTASLSPAAGLTDCISACCTTAGCSSFVYYTANASTSPASCEAGTPCCSLLSLTPPLQANPHMVGEVQSGTLPLPALSCAPPIPPFPASTLITGAAFNTPEYHMAEGDTWAITSALNGSM